MVATVHIFILELVVVDNLEEASTVIHYRRTVTTPSSEDMMPTSAHHSRTGLDQVGMVICNSSRGWDY
jgi:hypothetical protein